MFPTLRAKFGKISVFVIIFSINESESYSNFNLTYILTDWKFRLLFENVLVGYTCSWNILNKVVKIWFKFSIMIMKQKSVKFFLDLILNLFKWQIKYNFIGYTFELIWFSEDHWWLQFPIVRSLILKIYKNFYFYDISKFI